MKIKTYMEDIVEAASNLDGVHRDFLTERGWKFSSEHPDFRWRWSKKIKGRNYSLNTNDAIHMEEFVGRYTVWKNNARIDA